MTMVEKALSTKYGNGKKESGDTITKQMRRLGNSIDWSRERFTMDEGMSEAVQEAVCTSF